MGQEEGEPTYVLVGCPRLLYKLKMLDEDRLKQWLSTRLDLGHKFCGIKLLVIDFED